METVAALISQVPSLLLPLALGKGGYGQEARRQTPSGASPGDGVSGGTGAIQAPLPLGGAPGASRALPGPRGARLRLGTDSRRAGLRGADEACPVTRHGLWAGGQEPRWRPGAHPSHRSQRAGEARALVLGAETRVWGSPAADCGDHESQSGHVEPVLDILLAQPPVYRDLAGRDPHPGTHQSASLCLPLFPPRTETWWPIGVSSSLPSPCALPHELGVCAAATAQACSQGCILPPAESTLWGYLSPLLPRLPWAPLSELPCRVPGTPMSHGWKSPGDIPPLYSRLQFSPPRPAHPTLSPASPEQ